MNPGPRVRRAYSDTIADARGRLCAFLRASVDPDVGDDQWEEILRSASAWAPQGARPLDEHLAAHPDALIAPDPFGPHALVTLAHALVDAGFDVTLSRCADCGNRCAG